MNSIRELRKEHSLSQTQLAEALGVHQTAVSQWEKGRTAPDTDSLTRLAEYFGVTVDRILGKRDGEGVKIKVLGYIRAGIPIEAVEDVLDFEEITPEMAEQGEHFALRITGDSMMPRFCEDDVVIVRRQSDVDSGDIAVVMIDGTDATVKKLIKKDTSIVLVPLNSAYEPRIFTLEETRELPVTILGKVVELRAKFG